MYQERIRKLLPQPDPRHIEAFMILSKGTLDALSEDEFAVEARKAWHAADDEGPAIAEALALSYGL